MIIIMKNKVQKKHVNTVLNRIKQLGLKHHTSTGKEKIFIGVIGDVRKINEKIFLSLPGVEDVMRILKPYKLASREFHPENTIINIKNIKIGGKKVVTMAGPCAIENEKDIIKTAQKVKEYGAQILRGGAFKPRTSPYSFQGLGKDGLIYLSKAAKEYGLLSVTELMEIKDLDLLCEYADIIQIGARNMQNYKLLQAVGKVKKTVLLKRGISATLEEFILSAEYIMNEGNHSVILCERGIRTFVKHTRNTLDLNIVPLLKKHVHLPIIVDPSHATGKRELVIPMARASIAAGADGIMVEVHPKPEESISDADQTISPNEFKKLMEEIRPIAKAIGRTI